MIYAKAMPILRVALFVSVSVALGACQTISSVTKMDTPDARFAKELISSSCVFGMGKNGFNFGMNKKNEEKFIIRSISKGEEGWWRVGYIYNGNYWYHFSNKQKNLTNCGEESFRKKDGHRFIKVKEPIPDNAMIMAFGASSGRYASDIRDHSKQTDKGICEYALHSNEQEWDKHKSWKSYVKEAKKRNLTPKKCSKIIHS